MKIRLLLIISLLFAGSTLLAQPGQGKMTKEEIEAQKVAYITQAVDLTPEEAQLFWPVYNQFAAEMGALRKERKDNLRPGKKRLDELSDAEIEAMLDKDIELRQKESAFLATYHTKFKTVLPPRKLAKLYHAEDKFKRFLLEKMHGPKPRQN